MIQEMGSLGASSFFAICLNKSKISALAGKLDVLSPLGVISRGYALIEKDNKPVTKAKDLEKDDIISIKLSDGHVKANIIGE